MLIIIVQHSHQLLQLILTSEKAEIRITTYCILIAFHQFSTYFSCHFAMFTVRVTYQTNTHYIFQAKQKQDCHYSKPVMGSKIWEFKNILSQLKNEIVFHDYFDRKTWRAIWKFQIITLKKTNKWRKCRGKNDWFNGVRLHVFIILTKSKCAVRSGIRTHAYKSRLRPERSALDRSAILTCTLP